MCKAGVYNNWSTLSKFCRKKLKLPVGDLYIVIRQMFMEVS